MNNAFPYDIYTLDSHSLSYHALAQFKQILLKEKMPDDVVYLIEEQIIPALEGILLQDY
jgi:hypothetical protein